ncbi:MAG: hypothetical protein MRY83_07065 [Flavobacteriales bacterium]|nr:hypothetical protein [Flavobacteriales bacterium]
MRYLVIIVTVLCLSCQSPLSESHFSDPKSVKLDVLFLDYKGDRSIFVTLKDLGGQSVRLKNGSVQVNETSAVFEKRFLNKGYTIEDWDYDKNYTVEIIMNDGSTIKHFLHSPIKQDYYAISDDCLIVQDVDQKVLLEVYQEGQVLKLLCDSSKKEVIIPLNENGPCTITQQAMTSEVFSTSFRKGRVRYKIITEQTMAKVN